MQPSGFEDSYQARNLETANSAIMRKLFEGKWWHNFTLSASVCSSGPGAISRSRRRSRQDPKWESLGYEKL